MKLDITTHSNPRNLKVFCCYLNSYCSGPCGTSIVKNLSSPLFSGVCDLAVKRCCSWLMPGAVMAGEWMCVGFWFSFYMHIEWEEEKSELSAMWEQKTCFHHAFALLQFNPVWVCNGRSCYEPVHSRMDMQAQALAWWWWGSGVWLTSQIQFLVFFLILG